jgi:hypothetical protein
LIAVQRHNPKTHKAVYVLAHTAFYRNQPALSHNATVVKIPGKIEEFIVAAKLRVTQTTVTSEDSITGLPSQLTITKDPTSKSFFQHEISEAGNFFRSSGRERFRLFSFRIL